MRRLLLTLNFSLVVAVLYASPTLLLGAVSTLVHLSGRSQPHYTTNTRIAHALGQVDGHDYTNSREAFEASYRAGFRVFEIDLMVTADGQIVASHNANNLDAEFGISKRVANMTMQEFVAQRYYGLYHPLTFRDVLDLLQRYPDTHLILDVKDRPEDPAATFAAMHQRIVEQTRDRDSALLARMSPFLYRRQDLQAVQAYPRAVYTLYRAHVAVREVVQFVEATPMIVAVEFGREQASLPLLYRLQQRQIPAIVHTINDPAEAQALHLMGADSIITDVLAP